MKKRISIILAAALSFCSCASAAEVTYNPQDNSIGIKGEEYGWQSLFVLEEGQTPSDITNENSPVYARGFLADGAFDYTIPLSDDVASGYYNVFIGTDNTPYEVFVVNTGVADSYVKNTLDVQTSVSDFEEKLLSCKAELGINPDKIRSYSEPLSELLFAKKPFGDYTTFDGLFKTYEIYAKITTSDDVLSLLKYYEKELGTTLSEDYDTLNDEGKAMMLSLIKTADFIENEFEDIYKKAYLQALFCSAEYYTELKKTAEEHYEELGIDMDEIKACDDESEVYRSLMNSLSDIKTFDDIAGIVSKAAKNQKDKEDDESKSSGKKGSSGGGGGGGSVIVRPTETVVTPAAPAPEVNQPAEQANFGDLAGYDWALDAIASLKAKGIINGVSSDRFNPGANVTRAEFSKMAAGLLGLSGGNADFEDVDANAWYYPYVSACASNGLVQGDGNNFYPDASITREDAAVIVYRIAKSKDLALEGVKAYADGELISDYAIAAADALGANGIITGDENGRFNPKANLTRAEAAVLLYRLLGLISAD